MTDGATPHLRAAVIGVDIGTSSSKGVLVDLTGELVATATREHTVARPAPNHVEMDGAVWWSEFVAIAGELVAAAAEHDLGITAVGVSGMGPCTLLTDAAGDPLRPAILYGVDMRAAAEIAELTDRYGGDAIVARCRSALTSQAVGPKLAWVQRHEPAAFAAARRLFMPASYLAWQLTGEYVLDHHSASQAVPLYDPEAGAWYEPWWAELAGAIEPPRLAWSNDIAGTVTSGAAAVTGLPAGIPVTVGTIDAWAEAVSVGATAVGDLMLMYGTTMFLVATTATPVSAPPLWGTVGAFPGTSNLAAGMATSGAITAWVRALTGGEYGALLDAAAEVPPGADGLLLLPYFAGERTPFEDPDARGLLAGLTLDHGRGHLYRAALEATAMGVRHNLDAIAAAGVQIDRVVAVGGGTASMLWPQIVADVTGRPQQLRRHSIGASFGSAFLAAATIADVAIDSWNPPAATIAPDPARTAVYDQLYPLYLDLYRVTAAITHRLVTHAAGGATDRPTDPGPPTEHRKDR